MRLPLSAAASSACGLLMLSNGSSAFAPVSQYLDRPRDIVLPLHASANPLANVFSFMNNGKKQQREERAAAERRAMMERMYQNYYKYYTLDQEMNYRSATLPQQPTTITNTARVPQGQQKPFYKYAASSPPGSFPQQQRSQPSREPKRPDLVQRQLPNQRFETVDQRNQRLNLGFPANKRRSKKEQQEEEERARRVSQNYYKYSSYSLLHSQPRQQPGEY